MVSSPSFFEMRKRNIRDVLDSVRDNPGISRAELSKINSLAKATVSAIVDDLITKGVLEEVGIKASNGGRPAVGLEFNPSYGFVLGVSLDETEVAACLLDLNGKVKKQFGKKVHHGWNSSQINDYLIEGLKKCLKETGSSLESLLSVGMAVPGPVSTGANGEITSTFTQCDKVKEFLAHNLNCMPVVDSNTNMAAIAEIAKSEIPDSNLVFIVRIGHKIRSALVSSGNILGGSGGLAGEFGHVALPQNKRRCFCGARGCINTVASIGAMLQTAHEAGIGALTIQDLLELAEADNQDVLKIFEEAGKAIGFGLSQAINLLAPHVVIVSGPATSDERLIMRFARKKVNKTAVLENRTGCKIIAGTIAGKSESLGAGLLALRKLEISDKCLSLERLAVG